MMFLRASCDEGVYGYPQGKGAGESATIAAPAAIAAAVDDAVRRLGGTGS